MKESFGTTKWRKFWSWVDRDFDNVRPFCLVPLMLLPLIPVTFAFALDAGALIVEATRWLGISGVVAVFLYYIFRQIKNLIRYFGGGRR